MGTVVKWKNETREGSIRAGGEGRDIEMQREREGDIYI